MKLKMIPKRSRESATTTYYEVKLPYENNPIARIANFGAPRTDNWRILREKDETEKWSGRDCGSAEDEGHYKSAEEAFALLQKEYDGVAA